MARRNPTPQQYFRSKTKYGKLAMRLWWQCWAEEQWKKPFLRKLERAYYILNDKLVSG